MGKNNVSEIPLIKNSFVTCYSDHMRINLYYFPYGSKTVRYCEILSCELRPSNDLGMFGSKLWGMSLTPVWWHCDMSRMERQNYILLDANQWPKIGLTMDDNDISQVYYLIKQKMSGSEDKKLK